MACRCADIGKCVNDKGILNAAWIATLNTCPWANAIQSQLQSIMDNSSNAYTSDNIDEICTAIDKLNDDIDPALSGLMSEIVLKQGELDIKISGYKTEDTQHHEAERLAALRAAQQNEG